MNVPYKKIPYVLFSLYLLLAVVGIQPAYAAGIVVNTNADNLTAGDGVCTLREAITNANNDSDTTNGDCAAGSGPDTITFAADYTITLASELPQAGTEFTITGNGSANTIVQASDCNPITLMDSSNNACVAATHRILEINTGNVTLNDLTFRNGNCGACFSLAGGAININTNGTLTINNSVIANSKTQNGGGIWSGGTLTINDSVISGNLASDNGGGIYTSAGTTTLTDSTVTGNYALENGGGMYNDNSSPTLTNVTFSTNSASGGGGMYNDNSSPTLTDVTFGGNIVINAGVGGGMVNSASNPTLTNVTFSNNLASNGGGMYNENSSSPSLTDVTFSTNTAEYGGGMYNDSSSPSLTDVTFSTNTAEYGGGMFNGNNNPSLTDVTFSANSALIRGGGMYNSNSSPILTDVSFSANSADFGGGMFNEASSLTLTDVSFSANSADLGGGMFNLSSSPTLANVTFSANSALLHGGGMYNDNSSLTLTNVTFSGNSANFGGGMYNLISSPTLTNVIIANSTGGGDCVNVGGTLNASSSNNLIEDPANACGLTDGVGGNIIGSDPNLGPLANNGGFTQTHALLAGSDAIDTGDAGACPSTDQRGVTRPLGAGCDIGAYESGAEIPIVIASNPSAGATLASLSSITVVFNQDMLDDASADGAENVNNYLLVERGANASFDTTSCAGGVVSDDVQQTISTASYNSAGFITTLTLASPLANVTYRLFVCGTTSVWSVAGLELNNGADDATVDFTIGTGTTGSGTSVETETTASALPKTGFAPNRITTLPPQPANAEYAALGDLVLEIPSLNVKSTIVGVPQNADYTWDVTWLNNDTGWLNGTAFPTWKGNSVLTAHVTNASGLDGPFAMLKSLQYGDQLIVHIAGAQYIYEVRNTRLVLPYAVNFAFESLPDHSHLTLITCQGYNLLNESYLFRRVVRAVLLEVK